MNRPLTGRTALVTGGTRGLGAAIVRALATRGAAVAFSYVRSAAAAESLSREIRASGGAAEGFRADQADPTAAAGLPGRVLDRFGALEILVANASIDAFGRVDDPDRDEALFDRFWAVTAPSMAKLGPLIERLCLPRFGTVDEVAAAVAFLAGPDAAYITGTTLDVDGGYNA